MQYVQIVRSISLAGPRRPRRRRSRVSPRTTSSFPAGCSWSSWQRDRAPARSPRGACTRRSNRAAPRSCRAGTRARLRFRRRCCSATVAITAVTSPTQSVSLLLPELAPRRVQRLDHLDRDEFDETIFAELHASVGLDQIVELARKVCSCGRVCLRSAGNASCASGRRCIGCRRSTSAAAFCTPARAATS